MDWHGCLADGSKMAPRMSIFFQLQWLQNIGNISILSPIIALLFLYDKSFLDSVWQISKHLLYFERIVENNTLCFVQFFSFSFLL